MGRLFLKALRVALACLYGAWLVASTIGAAMLLVAGAIPYIWAKETVLVSSILESIPMVVFVFFVTCLAVSPLLGLAYLIWTWGRGSADSKRSSNESDTEKIRTLENEIKEIKNIIASLTKPR